MRSGPIIVACALGAFALSACGGSSTSPQDRIDGCVKIFLGGVGGSDSSDPARQVIAQSPDAQKTAQALCKDAEREGVLNDKGNASQDDVTTVLENNPEVLVPICEIGFRSGIGKDAAAVEQFLPAGGLNALATQYCSDLGPYVNDSGIDQEALFKDRGREVGVPICVATALAGVAASGSYPFSQADSSKLFTEVCGQAWDKGLVKSDGSADTAAVQALAAKIARQMVASGEITIQR